MSRAESSPDVEAPEPVSRSIARLLRTLPALFGPDVTDTDRADWFTRKAAVLDSVASAAADPRLAEEAACLAREARATAATYQHTTSRSSTREQR